MAGTAPSSPSADWKARKPANVPTAAATVQPDARAVAPWCCQSSEIALIAASATP